MVVTMEITYLWDVIPCGLVEGYPDDGGNMFLQNIWTTLMIVPPKHL
jgi:hypothetical protein